MKASRTVVVRWFLRKEGTLMSILLDPLCGGRISCLQSWLYVWEAVLDRILKARKHKHILQVGASTLTMERLYFTVQWQGTVQARVVFCLL